MNDSLSSKLINAISYAKSHTLDKGFLKKILFTVITIHSLVIFQSPIFAPNVNEQWARTEISNDRTSTL